MLNFKELCKDIIFRLSCDKCFGMWVIIVFEISDYSVKVQDEEVIGFWECVRGVSVEGDWSVCSLSYLLLCGCLYY